MLCILSSFHSARLPELICFPCASNVSLVTQATGGFWRSGRSVKFPAAQFPHEIFHFLCNKIKPGGIADWGSEGRELWSERHRLRPWVQVNCEVKSQVKQGFSFSSLFSFCFKVLSPWSEEGFWQALKLRNFITKKALQTTLPKEPLNKRGRCRSEWAVRCLSLRYISDILYMSVGRQLSRIRWMPNRQ